MTFLLAAALAVSAQPAPFAEREWLEGKANVERAGPRRTAIARGASAQPTGSTMFTTNLRVVDAVCRASSKVSNPRAFLDELGGVYGMTATEIVALHRSCAIYLAERDDR